jgi:hypothetical protein
VYKRRESCSVAKPNNLIYLMLVSYGAFVEEFRKVPGPFGCHEK